MENHENGSLGRHAAATASSLPLRCRGAMADPLVGCFCPQQIPWLDFEDTFLMKGRKDHACAGQFFDSCRKSY